MVQQLLNKKIVVTGGSGSIGKTIIKELSDGGSICYNLSRREGVDITDENGVEAFFMKIGKIDGLVLCHGINNRKSYDNISKEIFSEIINTNLLGTFFAIRSAVKYMNEGGKIVTIGSLTSQIGIPNLIMYGASKGALSAMVKGFAVELAHKKICINNVMPGRIRTEMTKDSVLTEESLRVIPQGRYGTPEDISGMVAFLMSDKAGYITGQDFVVDGGWLASGGNIKG